MTKVRPDDRRYESYETRAAYDPRYVIDSRHITSKAACKAAYAEADRIYIRMGEIRVEGRKHAHGSEEYERYARYFAKYAAERREIFRRIAEFEARA